MFLFMPHIHSKFITINTSTFSQTNENYFYFEIFLENIL